MSIVVKHLTKFYGETKAVDNLSFEIQKGDIVGFLGPNGAGKTTTVRMITGYIAPSSGTVEIDGKSMANDPFVVRRMIGYLPEQNPLYSDMDVIDYLEFISRLQDVPKQDIPHRIKQLVNMFNLQSVKHKDVSELSKGFRQRLGLAAAMVNDPPVLVLDEPTTGLDPNQILEFRNFISQLGKEKMVVLSTHALAEVQVLCNRVIIIGKGRMLADTPMSLIENKFRGREGFLVEIERPDGVAADAVQSVFEKLPEVEAVAPLLAVEEKESVLRFYIEAQSDTDLRKQLYRLCVEKNWVLLDLHRQHIRMEDIFHQLTTGKSSR